MAKMSTVDEFALVIIESIQLKDKPIGQTLHDEVVTYKKFEEENLSSYYYNINSIKEFKEIFDQLVEKAKMNVYSIVHIEIHGSEKGLMFSNGEVLVWEQFYAITRKLNVQMVNGLLIILSACEGLSQIGKFKPELRAPYFAIVSTFKIITEDQILKGFEAFYNKLFFSLDTLESVNEMNKAIGAGKPIFHVIKSEHMFDNILNLDRDPLAINSIINQLAVQEKSKPKNSNIPFRRIRKDIEKFIRTEAKKNKQLKGWFMMNDLSQATRK